MEAKRHDVSRWIDRKIRIYMEQAGCDSYEKAYRKVLGEDAALRQMYAGSDIKVKKGPPIKATDQSRHDAGVKLHALTTEYMTDHGIESYHQAMQVVLSEHPNLAREYSQV